MRRITRGAAAVAALCAGALTVSSLATAATTTPFTPLTPGSGTDAESYRVAGRDRIQTSLEALEDYSGQQVTVMIVGINGVVDALSLAPLTKTTEVGKSVVLYAGSNGLQERTLKALRSTPIQNVIIAGGYNAVPKNVEDQLEPIVPLSKVHRIAGANRFETSYLTGAYAKNWNGMTVAGQAVAQAMRDKEALAKAKAAYEKAVADNAAAIVRRDAAVEAYMAAVKKFNAEVIALGDTDVKTATTNLDSALNPKSYKALKQLEAVEKYLSVVEKATAVLKNKQEYADVDLTLQTVRDEAVKAGDTETVEAVDYVVAAVVTNEVDATTAGISLARPVGEARVQYDNVLKAARAALNNTGLAIAKALLKVQETEAAQAAMRDPKSSVSLAAIAIVAAEKAQTEAKNALLKSVFDLAKKRKDYHVLFTKSFDDFELAAKIKNFNDEVAKTYKAGNFNIFLSTGMNFADALTAGPAAAKNNGIVLLSNGANTPAYIMDALKASHKTVYGIGGPAAATFKNSVPVVGQNRYDTSAKVAKKFFGGEFGGVYALASGETGADAVVAGVYMASANVGATTDEAIARAVLLVRKNSLPEEIRDYISYGTHEKAQKPIIGFAVFGGEMVIKDEVVSAAIRAAKK